MKIACDHSINFKHPKYGCLLCERYRFLDEVKFLKGAHKEAIRQSLEPVVVVKNESLEEFVEEITRLNNEIIRLTAENKKLKKGGE